MIYQETKGNIRGQTLLFVHGWGLNRHVWESIADIFAETNKVVTIDLPGFGKSSLPGDTYSLQLLTELVTDIVEPDSIIVGWSLGGLVAMNIAIEHASKVKKLIAVSTSAQFVKGKSWPDAVEQSVFDEFSQALVNDFRRTIQRFLAVQSIGSERAREEIKILKQKLFIDGDPSMEALVGGLEILKSCQLQKQLNKIVCPTLLLNGERDTLTPLPSCLATAKLIPDCEVEVIPGAGHAPFISHPNLFIEKINRFIHA